MVVNVGVDAGYKFTVVAASAQDFIFGNGFAIPDKVTTDSLEIAQGSGKSNVRLFGNATIEFRSHTFYRWYRTPTHNGQWKAHTLTNQAHLYTTQSQFLGRKH